MQKAIVKTVFQKKGFGFVTLNNGDDVFFHVKVIGSKVFNNLKAGQTVNVEAHDSKRGLCATSLKISRSQPAQALYVEPKSFVKTKSETPKYGKVFYRRSVQSGFYRDPDEAEAQVKAEIQMTGCNALLNARMIQSKSTEGNYTFRVFSMAGDSALLMNKSKTPGEGIPLTEVSERVKSIQERIQGVLPSGSAPDRTCNVVYDHKNVPSYNSGNKIGTMVSLAVLFAVIVIGLAS